MSDKTFEVIVSNRFSLSGKGINSSLVKFISLPSMMPSGNNSFDLSSTSVGFLCDLDGAQENEIVEWLTSKEIRVIELKFLDADGSSRSGYKFNVSPMEVCFTSLDSANSEPMEMHVSFEVSARCVIK